VKAPQILAPEASSPAKQNRYSIGWAVHWQSAREPSHSAIGSALSRAGLVPEADPHNNSAVQKVGKQKRVRQALTWAIDNDEAAGSRAVSSLISLVRGCGGFLSGSSNYCGEDAIRTCIAAFTGQPAELTLDGTVRPAVSQVCQAGS
jgi:hypothetical protein